MKGQRLPLGVDVGATRVRVLEARMTAAGPRVHAVATRNLIPGASSSGGISDTAHVAAMVRESLEELRTKERRCVCSIGEPDAVIRALSLPRMTAFERLRAARFEAERHVEYSVDQAVVQVHANGSGGWTLGVARSSAVETRTAALRAAGLRPVAMDHESLALLRAFPEFDAVLDVGYQRASLHAGRADSPVTFQVFSGGADVTRGIRSDLDIDDASAEKRKRILGTAGAGERARRLLTADIAALIRSGREAQPIERIAIVGNSARLNGLAFDLERATEARCETAISHLLRSESYPDDVLRSCAPDWALAGGLALWSVR